MKQSPQGLGRGKLAFILYSILSLLMFIIFRFTFNFPNVSQSLSKAAASLAFFDRFIVEYLVIVLCASILIDRNLVFRILGYALFSFFVLVNIIQLMALRRGREFISPIALDNIGHISLLVSKPVILEGLGLFLGFLILPLIIEKLGKNESHKSHLSWRMIGLTILSIFVFQQARKWLPQTVKDAREDYYIKNNLEHTSPSLALYKVLFKGNDNSPAELTPGDAFEARKFGIVIDTYNHYPFVSDEIYEGKLPFEKLPGEGDRQPNIIVFFVEGMSARTINTYGSDYKDLTPNIDDFAKESMQVNNYYNHTAPTYRGLLGQYCSMFPTYAGVGGWDKENFEKLPKVDKFCLNHVLNKNNYQTVFFDTHRKDNAYVDEMMHSIGIDSVWTAEEISHDFLNNAEPLRDDALTDHQFLNGFIGWLKKNEKASSTEKPFMVGLYNLETHAWQDVGKDGKKYGDGLNNSLNTIHNYDHAFGEFWSYFKQSPYAKNTLVILTADHSHYSEENYIAAVQKDADYQPLFVDRIPLIIHDPTHKLPATFDANYSTSLDFTPSLIHLLELPNMKNPFFGTSMFSENRKIYDGMGLVSIGDDSYVVDKDMIHHSKNATNRSAALNLAQRVMKYAKKAEVENRLWNAEWNNEVGAGSAAAEENPAVFER